MGLFSLFKKKRVKIDVQIEATSTVKRRLVSEDSSGGVTLRRYETDRSNVSLKGIDKVLPNQFGNYLFPPEASFAVRGTNVATNRRKKIIYPASSEAEAIRKAMDGGLSEPFEVTLIPEAEPTERQLSYAKDLGMQIPQGACCADVSALLSRIEEGDEHGAPGEALAYLASRGWRGSSLIGYNAMLDVVDNYATDQRESLALYAYYIDQAENHKLFLNFDQSPRKNQYFAFADHALQNPKTIEHYKSWRRDGTRSTAKTWGINKAYREYFG